MCVHMYRVLPGSRNQMVCYMYVYVCIHIYIHMYKTRHKYQWFVIYSHVHTCIYIPWDTAPHCSQLLPTVPHGSSLLTIAPYCSLLLLTAPHCSSLLPTAECSGETVIVSQNHSCPGEAVIILQNRLQFLLANFYFPEGPCMWVCMCLYR